MGYYTYYQIDIIEGDFSKEKFADDFEILEKEISLASEYESETSIFEEDTKWYGHENDMLKFSRKYPELVFKLSGEGEESGDIWKKYFKNGKMHVAEVVLQIEDYNPEKLA